MIAMKGDISEEEIAVLESGDRNDPFVLWGLAPTYALAGRRGDSLRIAQLFEAQPTTRNLMHLCFTYSALGDMDKAFTYLEQSLEARTDWLPWIVFDNAYGGVIDPMRGHPRYQAVIERMNLPQTGVKKWFQ